MKRLWPWLLGTVAVALVGLASLRSLWLDAYGPAAPDPQGRHLAPAYAWLAIWGSSSVFMGLATTHRLLLRAHLAWAGLGITLLTGPVTVLGTFSLYWLAACMGVV